MGNDTAFTVLRTSFLRKLALSLGSVALLLSACKAPQPNKPNIIWVVWEDMSPDLHCYGNPMVRSPTLDRMAAQGIRYTNAFANGTVCTPSRTSIAVGMYQNTIGGGEMRLPDSLKPDLPKGVVPFTQLLQNNGYLTANITDKPGNGKLDWEFRLAGKPFEKNHWDALKGNQPFFAYINLHRTHRPFKVDTPFRIDPQHISIPPYYPDNVVSRKDFANYYGDIQELDQHIGDVLDSIRAKGLEKNTILFFFSDHGRDFPRAKHWLYNSGTHIPLIISTLDHQPLPNKLKRGSVQHRLINGIDITATTLALANVPLPSYLQGVPFLGKSRAPEREYAYGASDQVGGIAYKSRSVRNKQFLYIRNYNTDITVNDSITAYNRAYQPLYQAIDLLHSQNRLDRFQMKLVQPLQPEELYDLQEDTFQIHNLANDQKYQRQLIKMRKALDRWQQDIEDQAGLSADSARIHYFKNYRTQSDKKYKQKAQQLRRRVKQDLAAENNDL